MRKKYLWLLAAGVFLAAQLAGCGKNAAQEKEAGETGETGQETDESAEEVEETEPLNYSGEILVWIDDAAVPSAEEQIAEFQKKYPGIAGATFTIEAVEEADAAERMQADPAEGADVYVFAQDQTGSLAAAGALSEIPAKRQDAVRNGNEEGAVLAASFGDTLYAYPLTADSGALLYYDKSVVSDPSDLDTILEDCRKAGKKFYMELNSGWYQTTFFFGTGCALSYETDASGSFTGAEISYASGQGVTALQEMIHVRESDAFVCGSAAGEAEDMGAIVDGIWDAGLIKEKLGDNYACAKLPSFVGSDEKTYALSGFSGYRLLGVRPQTDENKQAVCEALAFFLSGKEQQLDRYEAAGWGPSNLEAQKSEEVQEDRALTALYEQLPQDKVQGQYPGDYWTLAAGLGDDVVTGTLSGKTSDADLLEALQTFQDTCLSYAGAEEETEELK